MRHKFLIVAAFFVFTIPVLGQSQASANEPAEYQPKKISVSGGVMAGMILTKVQPVYPMEAKENRVQGTVVLAAQIGPDGHISQLSVVQGPDALRKAAYDAVKNWVYRPYLLNGNPVSVDTQINVVFSLSR